MLTTSGDHGAPDRENRQSPLLLWQTTGMDGDLDHALEAVGPRLRALRRQRETTLTELSANTGVSVSTLSRLESGARRPNCSFPSPAPTASPSTNSSGHHPPVTRASTSARPPTTA